MNIKVYIYIITTLLSAYTLTGINFNKFWNSKKTTEARIFIILLSLIMSYLLTNFITDFLSSSKIL
ncbi:MAG: DUF1146 domain-containing protein [Bacilli bacterium]|nr:DUF1146 domain-containing protein [Bacilli bacterium]